MLAGVIPGHRAGLPQFLVTVPALEVNRHAQRQGLLALLHVPAEFSPTIETREWSRLDSAITALREGEKLIPEAVIPEPGIWLVQGARLGDCLDEQFLP